MKLPSSHQTNFMALDVGLARVGVAMASSVARLPHPHTTLQNDGELLMKLQQLSHDEHVGTVVVGLPRGLDGQDTQQTIYCRDFADKLSEALGSGIHVVLQDEALTSKQAEAELDAARKQYEKSDVDALAAVYILEDYLREHHSHQLGSL